MSNTAMANTAQALMDSMAPKFAVSYLRVSTRGQAERGGGHDEGFSIPAQREANKKKAGLFIGGNVLMLIVLFIGLMIGMRADSIQSLIQCLHVLHAAG